MVTTMQEKFRCRKGCNLFPVQISSDKGKEVEDADVLSRYTILQQFIDVFLEDITVFPSHMEVEFSIELVRGVAPASKAPYRMNTPKFVELKL